MLEAFDDRFEEEAEEESTPVFDYVIDWENCTISNTERVEDAEALKQWSLMALQVPRYRYRIFTWDYGSEFEELIGEGDLSEYVESEATRMVSECLEAHPCIESVSVDSISFEDTELDIEATINTTFGNAELYDIMEVE